MHSVHLCFCACMLVYICLRACACMLVSMYVSVHVCLCACRRRKIIPRALGDISDQNFYIGMKNKEILGIWWWWFFYFSFILKLWLLLSLNTLLGRSHQHVGSLIATYSFIPHTSSSSTNIASSSTLMCMCVSCVVLDTKPLWWDVLLCTEPFFSASFVAWHVCIVAYSVLQDLLHLLGKHKWSKFALYLLRTFGDFDADN